MRKHERHGRKNTKLYAGWSIEKALTTTILTALLAPPQPYTVWGNWKTCPPGYWIKKGVCVAWHEGQDVDFGEDDERRGSSAFVPVLPVRQCAPGVSEVSPPVLLP